MKTKVTLSIDPKLLALSRQNKVNLSQLLERSLQEGVTEYKEDTHKMTVTVRQMLGENKSRHIVRAIRYYLGKHPEVVRLVSDLEFEGMSKVYKSDTRGPGEVCTFYAPDSMYMMIRTMDLYELVDCALIEYNEQWCTDNIDELILESYEM